MGKNRVLFDIKIKGEKYYIVLTEGNKLTAVCLNNNKYVTVNDEEKIHYINNIIKMLNAKYVKRKGVTYNGEKLERYINKYTQKSYFAKRDSQGNIVKCSYDEYKDLYNIYNGIQTVYLINESAENSNVHEGNLKTQYTERNMQNQKPKNRAKKIILGLAGAAVTITISFSGWQFLREGKIQEVAPTSEAMEIEVSDEAYSADVDFIIDVINNNPNLQESEKEYIINTYTPIWKEKSQYINFYELASKYRNLEIVYDSSAERGNSKKSERTNTLLGEYNYDGPLVLTMGEYEEVGYNKKSYMTIYGASSIEEVLLDPEKRNTLNHELNHLNGGYSFYGEIGMELSEGFTELTTPDLTSRTYKGDRLMNIIFIETFGIDAIEEGYYGYNLQSSLTNRIVEKNRKKCRRG